MNEDYVLQVAIFIGLLELKYHAVVSNAGAGTSGTSPIDIDNFWADFSTQLNFDVLIDDVFYNENSIMVQLAKENRSEESAYNY